MGNNNYMNAFTYFKSLNKTGRAHYAQRAGTTPEYARAHLFAKKGPRKTPCHELLINLAIASEGNVSVDEAIDYFHNQPIKALYREMQADVPQVVKPLKGRVGADQLTMSVFNEPEKVVL